MAKGEPSPAADHPRGRSLERELGSLRWRNVPRVLVTDLYFLKGPEEALPPDRLESAVKYLFSDPVTQSARLDRMGIQKTAAAGKSWTHRATVLKRPGVMDPVEASAVKGLADLGIEGVSACTAARYYLFGPLLSPAQKEALSTKVLANPVIEEVVWDDEPVQPPFLSAAESQVERSEVPLRVAGDEKLLEISSRGQLSLNLEEMRAIQGHFRSLGREPTDVELETIAQTWSEHCCHKTFTGLIDYVKVSADGAETRERIDNLLRQTIKRATEAVRTTWCLSVFEDNAGVVAFDEAWGISFKVETHNHPSAIEPYGGAGTGIGGVIRDTLGTGLGAKPIVNTDVFCFGPPELPWEEVPPGALHPLRVLRGVVAGVRDYGNRMGIPTASGAIYFNERYAGNPLVYCGSVGLIPRDAVRKEVRPGDRIYVVGGRTGRDGIHGATFSSVELTEESEAISSGAVQIGNAITEKKVLDVLLQARDRRLFRAVTDCGAGGLSSAVGEMGQKTGARVQLEKVPLKYQGLSYTEIWISEAQERMVLAVPREKAAELEALARAEDVECTDIGEFTSTGRLELSYRGAPVSDLDMNFLHQGIPRLPRPAVYREPAPRPEAYPRVASCGEALHRLLAAPNIASKEWVIRQYDHEVQGGSILKSLVGPRRDGPGDAVAFTPLYRSDRAIVIGCGMNPSYGDLDPYRMALSAVDEALRNVAAAGGDPARTAILDNFSWGNTRRPEVLGALVEAARGCHDGAVGFGTPFISGKDSLNNEYKAGGQSLSIPGSLLISSLAIVEDGRRLVSMDLKEPGNTLFLVGETLEELGGSHYFRFGGDGASRGGGGRVPGVVFPRARRILVALHRAIRDGLILSAHDLSEGGLAVAAAEMAFSGVCGCEIHLAHAPAAPGVKRDEALLFSESNTRFLLEVESASVTAVEKVFKGLPAAVVGTTSDAPVLRIFGMSGAKVVEEGLDGLRNSWKSLSRFLAG
ncbi:MAG: phosphoribosylformylglycinamidine synthase subunit PurL [Planctomycetes bacterium]|nr:phosphoribosylformylglycinamidine synthase subunit PurL [Planctomycetota bacterium]